MNTKRQKNKQQRTLNAATKETEISHKETESDEGRMERTMNTHKLTTSQLNKYK